MYDRSEMVIKNIFFFFLRIIVFSRRKPVLLRENSARENYETHTDVRTYV